MPEHDEHQQPSRRSKAEMLKRFTGPTLRHDEEDIEFWRNATDEIRGRTLYNLLKMVDAIGRYPEKEERFPGFGRVR